MAIPASNCRWLDVRYGSRAVIVSCPQAVRRKRLEETANGLEADVIRRYEQVTALL